MNKKDFDEKYVGSNVVVNCNTLEKAIEFLGLADSFGYTWVFDIKYSNNTRWGENRHNTCYSICRGTFGSLEYFREEGYTIVGYEKENNFFKTSLRTGDMVVYRNGLKRWVVLNCANEEDILLNQEMAQMAYLCDFDNNLKSVDHKALDIIEVWRAKKNSLVLFDETNYEKIWDANEDKVIEMSIEEAEKRLASQFPNSKIKIVCK